LAKKGEPRLEDVKMVLRKARGGGCETTRGDICRSLPACNELFIDPRNKTQVARENREGEHNREAGKEKLDSAL
jgi:hypothetical protein